MSELDALSKTDQSARTRVLLTAHDLFYQHGIRATGIDRVIAMSGVAKATFYRHFPSKNDLVLAFLEYRHQCWMVWFTDALRRHGAYDGAGLIALAPVLAEWFGNGAYRGCAFINSVVELGSELPKATEISLRHKQEMTEAIIGVLPVSAHRGATAQAAALAVDGAIVQAQCDDSPDRALNALEFVLRALQSV